MGNAETDGPRFIADNVVQRCAELARRLKPRTGRGIAHPITDGRVGVVGGLPLMAQPHQHLFGGGQFGRAAKWMACAPVSVRDSSDTSSRVQPLDGLQLSIDGGEMDWLGSAIGGHVERDAAD